MLEVAGAGSLEDRARIILDELSLGNKWGRPCIIVAVYRSDTTRDLVQTMLTRALAGSGQIVIHYVVDKSHYDIPSDLRRHPKNKQAVYFISGLRWGGGRRYSNAYRALNMHREYLVDGNIQVVFWLTKSEAKQMARFAPDFWAFRHKVYDFPELPVITGNDSLGLINSYFQYPYSSTANDFRTLINAAEEFYALGCMDEAIQNFRKALRKHPGEIGIPLRIAEVYLSMGRLSNASPILKQAGRKRTNKDYFAKELARLNKVAESIGPASGGFLEPMV